MLSEQLLSFKCELCPATFYSSEELDAHRDRFREPQPTLPESPRKSAGVE